jgi:hypothetical protein
MPFFVLSVYLATSINYDYVEYNTGFTEDSMP